MFDFNTCFDHSEYKLLNLNQCLVEDELIASSLSNALTQLDAHNESYGFYKLHLSEREEYLLSQIKLVQDYNVLVSYSNSRELENEITEFFLANLKNDYQFISELSSFTTKLAEQIIASSGYGNAEINILAAHTKEQGNYFPCWHVDKTHEEEIIAGLQSQTAENVFIVSLKGASTLFHQMSPEVRIEFNKIANETMHGYGYNFPLLYLPNQGIDKLFSVDTSESAEFGLGSVHKAGYLNGAIHANANGMERLMMIVIPSETSVIDKLKTRDY